MGQLRVENGCVVEELPPLRVEFFEHAKKVGVGRWEPVTYIKIKPSQDSTRGIFSRAATDKDKLENPVEWERYQKGQELDSSGTSLRCLPDCKTAFEMELKSRGINTVELLAAQDAPHADYIVPLWEQAKVYIKLMGHSDES